PDPRARGRAGDPRRRRRDRVRRGAGDGAGLRRRAVRERDLARRGPGGDGARDPARRRGRPARLPRGPDPPPALRAGLGRRGGRRRLLPAVVGPGAIAATIAACLHEAGTTLVLCGRSARTELVVVPDDGQPITVPGPVLTDPSEVSIADTVFLAVKATQTE